MFIKSPAEKKSKEVQKLLKKIVEGQGVPVKHITALGYKYDSGFWIAVQTDSERERLYADPDLLERLQAVFEESGYNKIIEEKWNREINDPRLGYLKKPGIQIESQETVDRDYKGNWYYCMK